MAEPHQWRQVIAQELLQKWHALSGKSLDKAKIEIENLPDNYAPPKCQQSFRIEYIKALKPGRNSIKLVCKSPFWQQNLSVRLRWFQPVAFFAKPVRSKQSIKTQDVRMVEQDIGELNHGYFINKQELVGMIARRQFSTGTQIVPSMLNPKIIIQRGQSVVIRFKKPQIKIEIKGKALSDGSLMQKIRVKNSRSKKILVARVVAAGVVQID